MKTQFNETDILNDLLDELNATAITTEMMEQQILADHKKLTAKVKREKLYAIGNYKNLMASQIFHACNDYKKQANALNFDLDICSKTLGKKITKALQEA